MKTLSKGQKLKDELLDMLLRLADLEIQIEEVRNKKNALSNQQRFDKASEKRGEELKLLGLKSFILGGIRRIRHIVETDKSRAIAKNIKNNKIDVINYNSLVRDCTEISAVIRGSLIQNDIDTIGDMLMHSESEYLHIRRVGAKGLRELKIFLEKHKLKLKK